MATSTPTPTQPIDLLPEITSLRNNRTSLSHLNPLFKPHTLLGSCHCRLINYLIFPNLPTPSSSSQDLTGPEFFVTSGNNIYRCNCTTCHKLGIFHWRFENTCEQFAVLTPVESGRLKVGGEGGVRSYRVAGGDGTDWWFCGRCGVRCFSSRNVEFENGEREVDEAVVQGIEGLEFVGEDGNGLKKVKVLKPSKEAWDASPTDKSKRPAYLSVNATSINANQDGFDMRELHEKGRIGYLDRLTESGGIGKTPYPGGMY